MNRSTKILAAALMATTMPWFVAPTSAAPISSPLVLRDAVAPAAETVQFRGRGFRGGRVGAFRGGYRGRGFGGPALGLGIAGAVIGGALLATQPYGPYGYPYGYGPYGYGPGYVVVPQDASGDAVAYCQQRFRSYDPGSGTYLGLDGLRHPCP